MFNCWKTSSRVDKVQGAQNVADPTNVASKTGLSVPSTWATSTSGSSFTVPFYSGKSTGESLPTSKTEDEILSSSNPKAFTFNELKNATRNFRRDSLLGEGQLALVFKGWIDGHTLSPSRPGSGMVVAISKLKPEVFQGVKEWLAEIHHLSQLQHPNLVKLIGYCVEDDNRLLVYEFMPRGSLEYHLFRKTAQPLSWATRIKIAVGAARGLSFLHDSWCVLTYRNLKPSNILLGEEFNAKLSGLELQKTDPTGDGIHVSTRVFETYGYDPPEFIATGRLSVKSDVYSFGVILLELLSGRRAIDRTRVGMEQNLVDWAKPYLGDKRKLHRIMDPRLGDRYPMKEAFNVASLALQCLCNDAKLRPQMSKVLGMLEPLQDSEDTAKLMQMEQQDVPSHISRSPMRHHRPLPLKPLPSGGLPAPPGHLSPLIWEKPQKSVDSLVYVEEQEKTLSTIREHLHNDGVAVIGIQGVGGVGKTTLLRKLYNEFCSKQDSGFDVVIMVTASEYSHHKKIQKEIGEQLGLSLLACGPLFLQDMQAAILRQALSQQKFLLILDGVQEMDWDKIGIPPLDRTHRRKIIFAIDVCEDLKNVEIVKMKSLNALESWELFSREIQDKGTIENQSIKPLAKQVVSKCGGLPLALTIVGRAMASKEAEQDWKTAIEKLDSLAKDFASEQSMDYALKFSYDYLQDDTLRSCLLYCSLFPENHDICVEELIQYWFGEGLLLLNDIHIAHHAGHTIIKRLKAASLLVDGTDKENAVKMHNVVRDFVLRLTSCIHEQADLFLVHSGRGLREAPDVKEWRRAARISLIYNEIEILPDKNLRCPKLSTLLLNKNTSLKQIPKDFFQYMPTLCVLDLSYTGIEELPKTLGLLPKLQFLSLSHTYIRSMPKELGCLVQLRQLDLSYMFSLTSIPQKAILKLSRLQMLNLYNTSDWCSQEVGRGKNKGARIQDLQNFVQLKDLSLTTKSLISLMEVRNSPNLLRTTRCLGLMQIEGLTSNLISDILGKLEMLQVLQISEASQLEELRFPHCQSLEVMTLEHLPQATFILGEPLEHLPLQKLRRLLITGCHAFKDLNWVHLLPSLENIELRVCYGMKEIATGDGVEEEIIWGCSFPRLKIMRLWDLPRLERISTSSLFLPFLEYIEVFHCPKLKKLPLTVESAKRIKDICGHQEWWDGLEWDHQSVKANFLRHFKDARNYKEMAGQLRLMGSNY